MPKTEQHKYVSSPSLETKPLFIRRAQLKQITGLSQSTIWRLEADGVFPKRRKVGHCVGWLYSELKTFIEKAEAVNS